MNRSPDSGHLPDQAAYFAALEELDKLMFAELDTPAGRRFEELAVRIEEYEAHRDGYDLARMRRVLADST